MIEAAMRCKVDEGLWDAAPALGFESYDELTVLGDGAGVDAEIGVEPTARGAKGALDTFRDAWPPEHVTES